MNRHTLAAIVVLGAVVGVGFLFAGGSPGGSSGPLPIADDATTTTDVESPETETESGSGSDGSEVTPTGSYAFAIEKIEECGSTCRNVTATLANDGQEARRNVRVTTEVYADGDLLWTSNETVGTLRPGEAHVSTRRVDLGLEGAMKIRNDGGYVTIVTVVRSDGGTVRFEDRRKVA